LAASAGWEFSLFLSDKIERRSIISVKEIYHEKKITITPIQVADLLAEASGCRIYVHVIDHPDARVLVDTRA